MTSQTKQQLLDDNAALKEQLHAAMTQLSALSETAVTAAHEDVPVSQVQNNANDFGAFRPGVKVWITTSLERGAKFENGALVPAELAAIVPGAWVDSLITIAGSMHPYTAENTLDGLIYGCNSNLRRLDQRLGDHHTKIRSAMRGFLAESDPERKSYRKESIEKMTFFLESLKQQARELLLYRAAAKVAWTAVIGGVHQPRDVRIAERRSLSVAPADMDATMAQALAATGAPDAMEVNAGRGAYQPVNDGTAVSADNRPRPGIDGDADERNVAEERGPVAGDSETQVAAPF